MGTVAPCVTVWVPVAVSDRWGRFPPSPSDSGQPAPLSPGQPAQEISVFPSPGAGPERAGAAPGAENQIIAADESPVTLPSGSDEPQRERHRRPIPHTDHYQEIRGSDHGYCQKTVRRSAAHRYTACIRFRGFCGNNVSDNCLVL